MCCSVMVVGVSHFDRGLFNTVSRHNQLLGAMFVLNVKEGAEQNEGPVPGTSVGWLCYREWAQAISTPASK